MKKLFLVVVALFTVSAVFAQGNYKAFKVDAGALYAVPGGDGYTGGIGFYLEPKYNVTDNIAAGLKMEWAIIGGESNAGTSVDVSAVGAYQLTGDYYFSSNKVRPFAGLGVGIFNLGTSTFGGGTNGSQASVEIDYGSKFGFTPRVGVLLGHLRAAVEYNVITGIKSGLENRNYLSIKLGFEIGGGKK